MSPNGMSPQDPLEEEAREFGYYFALSQAGLEMVAPLIVGAWLDWQFDWSPWCVIVGTVVGFVGGIIHLILMAQRIEQNRTKKKQ